MKISIISTVFNEEDNISSFLDSLMNQSLKPEEIIIVDGGSTDKTFETLKLKSKRNKILKVFQEEGANISRGRNIAISKSRNEIIVGADAGTEYERNWLEELVKNFDSDVGFGQTLPLIKTDFQKALSKQMKQRFGSSRNIIFKKSVWEKVGGYPEDLDIAEDTVFNERIKKEGYKIKIIPEARGHWEMRKDFEGLKKQFYRYGYWDGIAYKRYKILTLKSKIAIVGLSILFVLYPVFVLSSLLSISAKIWKTRRFSYLKGFVRGFLRIKE
jgi:glycosyltransferase involved in cell wall biosynthesis